MDDMWTAGGHTSMSRLGVGGALSLLPLVLLCCSGLDGAADGLAAASHRWQSSNHTNNWAVLVCTSRFWFNYRHMANALSVYHTAKRLGIPDSNIILMLADDMACNPRNPKPAAVFNNRDQALNLYGAHVEVDYRGYEVTVENFIRVLTGRHDDAVPRSKRLLSDSGSNILVMLTGHGGDEFMKFQDDEELLAQDLADAIAQMDEKKRYNELLLFVETCEASTMWKRVYSPRVLGMASSILGEKSYSHHSSPELGLSVIDRFTYYTLMFFQEITGPREEATMQQLFDYVAAQNLASTAALRTSDMQRPLSEVRVTDFFGAVMEAAPQGRLYPFTGGHGEGMKTEPRGGAEEGEHGDDGREQQQDRDEGRRPQAFRVPLAWQAMAFAAASLAAVVASQPRMESLGGAANPL